MLYGYRREGEMTTMMMMMRKKKQKSKVIVIECIILSAVDSCDSAIHYELAE